MKRTLVLLLALAGCTEAQNGYNVPGITLGMTERAVTERLGAPTRTRTVTVATVDSVNSMTWNLDLAIYQWTTTLPAGVDSAVVRRSTWEHKERWPWQPTQTWEVGFAEQDGTWRVVAQFADVEGMVIG